MTAVLAVLEFVFSGFWTWLGTVVLVAAFGQGIGMIIAAMRGR